MRSAACPEWVKTGIKATSALSPLYLELRTLIGRVGMSLSCHKQSSDNFREVGRS